MTVYDIMKVQRHMYYLTEHLVEQDDEGTSPIGYGTIMTLKDGRRLNFSVNWLESNTDAGGS